MFPLPKPMLKRSSVNPEKPLFKWEDLGSEEEILEIPCFWDCPLYRFPFPDFLFPVQCFKDNSNHAFQDMTSEKIQYGRSKRWIYLKQLISSILLGSPILPVTTTVQLFFLLACKTNRKLSLQNGLICFSLNVQQLCHRVGQKLCTCCRYCLVLLQWWGPREALGTKFLDTHGILW